MTLHRDRGSYTNPVYPRSCPDPFILKYCGEYFCYSTGWAPDGRVFDVLHSTNLIDWKSLGGAMAALPGDAPEYWAPEVIYSNGRFFLYYSVGDGVEMRLRVAAASSPAGPYKDSGRLLSDEDFAIDAHVFEDDDGTRYLFYAKDFLDHTHIGTGTVVDRMIDEVTLEGKPRPVTLPHYDWQVFDPCRLEKGGVRWHTVEGPFVLKHKGRYYQMFSGGNWKNLSYGVSYAVADSIDSQYEWSQLEHSEEIPLVLSTTPGRVIGPGHNSVVRGTDNRQLYCVYHRWAPDESTRLLSLDRLEFIGDRLSVLGPSTTPQNNPNAPLYPIFHERSGLWQKNHNELVQSSAEKYAETAAELETSCFMFEGSFAGRSGQPASGLDPEIGLRLYRNGKSIFSVGVSPSGAASGECGDRRFSIALPKGFVFSAWHLLRLDVSARHVEIGIDGRTSRWRGYLDEAPDQLALFSGNTPCSFKACSLTYGFEDNFFGVDPDPACLGWRKLPAAAGVWRVHDKELLQNEPGVLNSVLIKEHPFTEYELVINARHVSGADPDSCYGFYPAYTGNSWDTLMKVEVRDNRPCLSWYARQEEGAWQFPGAFDRGRAQQFRFRRCNGRIQVSWEDRFLGTLAVPDGPARAALYVNRACAGFDLVRLTSLN